jgi:hypothetical protein
MTAFPLCEARCDQAPAFGITFTDPLSTLKVNRYACANHLTGRVWRAVMQAGPRPVTITPLEP